MQDEASAMRMQTEAELLSPLLRVKTPSLSAAMFMHKMSESKLPSDPAMRMGLKEADLEDAAKAGGQTSAMRAEMSVHDVVLDHLPDLMTMSSDSGGSSAVGVTAKMLQDEDSKKCQLQRLLSKLEITVDLSQGMAMSSSERRGSGPRGWPAAARAVLSDFVSRASSALRTWAVPPHGQVQLPKPSSAAAPAAMLADPGSALPHAQAGGRRNWLPDGVITSPGMQIGFGFKEYEFTGASTVDIVLKVDNLLAFPLRVQTGKYVVKCFAPPPGTPATQHAQHLAMTLVLDKIDTTFVSRDEVRITLSITFDNHTRVGGNVLSPALLGKSLVIKPQVDFVGGDATLLSKAIDRFLTTDNNLKEGFAVNAMDKAPVKLVVDVLNKITLAAPTTGGVTDQLDIDLQFKLNIPGASLILPFKIPKLRLELMDEDSVVRTDVGLAVDIAFSGVTVDLKTQIKEASTRCNALLSAVAFNAAAQLRGNVSIGDVIDPFPVRLDMAPGLWVTQSIFDASAATVSGTPTQSAEYCGLSGIEVQDARVCNYQNRTVKAEIQTVRAGVSNKAAGNKRMTDLFALSPSRVQFDGSACVVLQTTGAVASNAESAAANASCAAHRTSAQASANLGVVSPELVLSKIMWCKEGVNKCGSGVTRGIPWPTRPRRVLPGPQALPAGNLSSCRLQSPRLGTARSSSCSPSDTLARGRCRRRQVGWSITTQRSGPSAQAL